MNTVKKYKINTFKILLYIWRNHRRCVPGNTKDGALPGSFLFTTNYRMNYPNIKKFRNKEFQVSRREWSSLCV